MSAKTIKKIFIILIVSFSIILCSHTTYATLENTYATLENTEEQYMELKVVDIIDVDGADKQIILEWWSYNLNFKAVDVRFSYDETKIKPSNLQTNAYVTTSDGVDSFEFAGDFASYMAYMTASAENGEYRCTMSLENYDDTGTYIENDTTLGYIVNSNVEGGVLLGRMSFRLYSGDIDETTFALKTGTTSPMTGVQVAQTYTAAYEDPSVFRFTILSDDATLKEIQYDFFNYNEENGAQVLPQLTYEQLDLSQKDADSTDDVSKYTINLLEDLNNISLKLEKSNENAVVKIDNVEIDTSQSKELVLKNLGEEDTVIDIVVTAEDGKTIHTYKLVIHKPYATIKGSITTPYTTDITGKYICDIYVYKEDDVAQIFDWDTRINEFNSGTTTDTINADLHTINEVKKVTTNDDGTFEINVIPGTYDVLQDKLGYLDHIYIYMTVAEGDVIDLGNYELIAGDSNKDGIVQLRDKVLVTTYNGKSTMDADYSEAYDLNNDGQIQLRDKVIVTAENGKKREIVDYRN